MKRGIIAVILLLGAFLAYSQNTGPIDLILLLDTSSSMSDSYEQVNDYISGAFLREFLRIGDTFHLISFSDKPKVDITRRIEGRGELETLIGRMFLQYPLDPSSDTAAALRFVETYTASLPSRPKKIVIVSDEDVAGLTDLINAAKTRLGRQEISLDYVQVRAGQPLANLPRSGRAPLARAVPSRPAETPSGSASPAGGAPAQTGRPAQTPSSPASPAPGAPAQTGRPAQTPTSPASPAPGAPAQTGRPAQTPGGSASPAGGAPAQTGQQAAQTPGVSPDAPAVEAPAPAPAPTTPPASVPPDSPAPPAAVPLSPAAQVPPAEETPPVQAPTVRPAEPWFPPWEGGFPLALLIGLAVLGLLAAGFIIVLVTRRLQRSPNRVMAMAAAPIPKREEEPPSFKDHSKDLADFAASRPRQRTTPYAAHNRPRSSARPVEFSSGPLLLNLFVEDQNTFIGKRNIHALKSGYSFTVGGGKSDFLIFLVPIPPAIGEIRREGNRCSFIPRKPRYFPDLGSSELPDCIGKTIRVISDKHYELHFRLERYENPLIALNRLLNSIKIPGRFDADLTD